MIYKKTIDHIIGHIVLYSILGGVFGSIVLLIATSRYGIGVSPDSTIYLDCARSISEMEGYQTFFGTYHRYGPFYPLLLSFFEFIGWDAMVGAVLINIASFILIMMTGTLILKRISGRSLIIPGLLLMITSRHLFNVSVMAWTEPLFISMCMVSLLFLIKYLEEERIKFVIIAGMFASIAASTRYLGITLIFTGCILLLLHGNKGRLLKRIKNTLIFGSISSAPATLFLIRNYIKTSTLIGDRPSSASPVLENLYFTFRSMTNWFIPGLSQGSIEYIGITFFSVVLVIVLIVIIWSQASGERKNESIFPVLYFFLIYVLYINISAALVGFDNINDRFISPVFIPFVILLIFAMSSIIEHGLPFLKRTKRSKSRMAKVRKRLDRLFFGGSVFVAVLSFLTILLLTTSLMSNGAGRYSSAQWQESETIDELLSENFNATIISNDPWVINHLAGIEDLKLSPRETYQRSDRGTEDIDELSSELDEKGSYILVWFKEVDREYLYKFDQLVEYFNITLISDHSDGSIHWIDI